MLTTIEIAKKLVDLCREGKFVEAIDVLYAPNIVSIEPFAPPGQSPKMEGIAAVKGKADWWMNNHTVHSGQVEGPWPHGDRFIVRFKFDVTPKIGPTPGKRMTLDETALYTVKDGKVVHEEFFFYMGG